MSQFQSIEKRLYVHAKCICSIVKTKQDYVAAILTILCKEENGRISTKLTTYIQ